MQGNSEALPTGWASTTVGDICDKPEYGWTTKAVNSGSGPRLLRTTDISKGSLDWSTVPFCDQKPPSLEKYLLKRGDIVVSRSGSVGLSALIGNCPEAVFASYLIRFRTRRGISVQYLHYFLQSPSYWEQIAQESAGIALQNVNAKKLAALTIPLAPLAEQKRIVSEIEQQFTRLDAAEAALRRVEVNLKRYRASVLKEACEGKLVPTEAELAEAEGRDYEHAEQLLERILAERRAQWESQEKRRGKSKEPVPPDTSDLPELPEGWVWSNLDQLADVGTGSTPLTTNHDFYQGGNVPWVTSSALNNPLISTPSKFITELAIRECNLTLYPPHTLLIAMYGEGKTRGKCSELLFESAINQAIAAIRLPQVAIDSRPYVRFSLTSNYEKTRRLAKGGVQPNLNLSLVRQITIPLPPLAEQQRIVGELERHLSVIQQAEISVLANLKRVGRLRQSILKRAFSGKLVPQDSSDEPATELLEHILAERSATRTATSSKNQTRRRSNSTSDRQLRLLENGQ